MLIPLLRVVAGGDLKGSLSSWLDGAHQNNQNNNNTTTTTETPEFTAAEIVQDLTRLDDLRSQIGQAIPSFRSYQAALDQNAVSLMQEYHAGLLECENRGFGPATMLHLGWTSEEAERSRVDTLALERASLLWNLGALEAFQASQQDFSKKQGWQKANKHLQAASSMFHHLAKILQKKPHSTSSSSSSQQQESSLPSQQLQQQQQQGRHQQLHHHHHQQQQQQQQHQQQQADFGMVPFWEKTLQAQAQMAGYEMAHANARPRHMLLAKLATGAVPLWREAAGLCVPSKHAVYVPTAETWGLYLQAKAEHHESITHKDKSKFGMETARLERSVDFLNQCNRIATSGERVEERLVRALPPLLEALHARLEEARALREPVPDELREIRGEVLSKGPQPLPKAMLELQQPLFGNVLGPKARVAVEAFYGEMERLIVQMTGLVEEKTEAARKMLASVNLPHSLTAYKQEQSGGGIPMDLWERVDAIQRQRKIHTLKNDLWGLRDVAEQARSVFGLIRRQLEEDIEMDTLFRQQHPSFEGHNVPEIQRTYRGTLANYDKLLSKSQEGDALLLRRLGLLDTDPKFKLLQFQKSQLDRLLPGSGNSTPMIDTTHLSRLLVELSTLFHERDVALNMLRAEAKNYNIRAKLAEVDPESVTLEQDYHHVVVKAQKSFSGIAYDIQLNIDKQVELLDTILQENERFMEAREANASSAASDSCIAMIEDAIEEIDQLTKHLKEGRRFYDVVIPKLEQLKQQVGDASVRLTVERCEFEDKAQDSEERRRQELDDARMAASLAGNNNNNNNSSNNNSGSNNLNSGSNHNGNNHTGPNHSGSGGGGGGNNGSHLVGDLRGAESHPLSDQPGADYQARGDVIPSSARSQPGVVNVPHNQPQVRVDDEKVASLIAMDFDPDKVVAALRKYDNNVEQALNELLSC